MILEKYPEILYAASDISDGNMSFVRGDPKEALKNRQQFLAKVGLNLDSIVVMSPQHGTEVKVVSKSYLGKGAHSLDDVFKVDGLITREPRVNLFLAVADCIPLILYDPEHQAIGIFHAGWQGLVKGMMQTAIDSMVSQFTSQPQQLIAEIGPSVGPCCYKIDLEKEQYNSPAEKLPAIKQSMNPQWQPYIIQSGSDFNADLWKFAEDRLKESGIRAENIHNQKVCSYHSGQYFSHRKFKIEHLENDYRFAVVVGLKNGA